MNHASFFTGKGGFDIGAALAGIETKWRCEINEHCRAELLQNSAAPVYPDITKMDFTQTQRVDIISAGFPCQDISVGNTKAVGITGARSSLWNYVYEAVTILRPPYLVIENSPRLIQFGLEQILRQLAEIGYDAEWRCLRACDFDLPHRRTRLFLVAYPNSKRRLPAQVFGRINVKTLLKSYWQERESVQSQLIRMDSLEIVRETHALLSSFDDGLSASETIEELTAYGNAVCPAITRFIFELIKLHTQL